MQINSLKNKSTMQKQVIVYRINAIPKGSVMTVTNDEKEILKRNVCGFFHEEIFSSVVNEDDILNDVEINPEDLTPENLALAM